MTDGPRHLLDPTRHVDELYEDLKGDLPVRRYAFKPAIGWLFDLAWPDVRAAVVVERCGSRSAGTKRLRAEDEDEAEMIIEATLRGWTVLRVTRLMVKSGIARGYVEGLIQRIRAAGVPS